MFHRLELIERVYEDGGPWHCTGGSDQDHHEKKINEKGKMVVWGGLTNSYEKEEKRKAKEKRKDIPIWMQSS